VFVVAITHLATPADVEATALAPQLGKTVYETRLVLNGGSPAIVSTTSDREAATALLAAIRARGHGAVACDDQAVNLRREMTLIGQFGFDAEELVSLSPSGTSRMRYDEVLALVRGIHKLSSAKTRQVTEKKFAAGRALLTGGLATRKSTTREVIETFEDREEVLYLFRRDGSHPWLLVDAEAKYQGLGDRLARTQRENFLATVECLRAMCPGAAYDERLLSNKRIPERFTRTASAKATETSSSDGVDLLAHVLALAIARGQAGQLGR
jgi:hypothetical protein